MDQRKPVDWRVPVAWAILLGVIAGLCACLASGAALAQSLSLDLGQGGGVTERALQLVAVITVLSLAPSILIMVTSFTRIVVVLSLLRTALGTAYATLFPERVRAMGELIAGCVDLDRVRELARRHQRGGRSVDATGRGHVGRGGGDLHPRRRRPNRRFGRLLSSRSLRPADGEPVGLASDQRTVLAGRRHRPAPVR